MLKRAIALLVFVSLTSTAYTQDSTQQKSDDTPIRISTELIQLDVVVTDKNGKVVTGLTKDDFELSESGKKQTISFFEFVESAIRGKGAGGKGTIAKRPDAPSPEIEDLTTADVKRIFAFVIDDLTIRGEDLTYVREMLTRYVNDQMGAQDLVAIIRTVGGRGLLQQFTSNKQLLQRAIDSLSVSTHPLSVSATTGANQDPPLGKVPDPLQDTDAALNSTQGAVGPQQSAAGEVIDEARQVTRAIMTLGTASFVIDSMKQLPGRKSLVLVSGGLPILGKEFTTYGVDIGQLVNRLADNATRAGVAVHTLDIRGLSANAGVASFVDTPGKSAIPTDLGSLSGSLTGASPGAGFGRGPNEALLGRDVMQDQLGLRVLASATGGLSFMNKNNFTEGLGKIVDSSEGYYLLAYTPQDEKFDGKYRRLEVKVKRSGLKVLTRSGYFARVDKDVETPKTRDQELLAAVRSPLARRDINVSALMTYRAVQPPKDAKANSGPYGAIDIHMLIDPKTLKLEEVAGKQNANFDVAVFVFDEFGEMRGGFSKTIDASLTPEEFARINKGGLSYAADTQLPPGVYQLRMAVRDNKTGSTGTMQRYIEVPDLTKGKLAASSLIISAAPPGDTKTPDTTAVTADQRISRTKDLRYAVMVYNAKLKEGKPQVRVQMSISQDGKVLHKEPEEIIQTSGSGGNIIKIGQLGLSRVPPGRYTISLTITDPLADKKWQALVRTQNFIVE
jgi:VWFA-related protein